MSYQGHHPVHTGLQRHSVGGAYPLALVIIQNPTAETYGKAADHVDKHGCIYLVQNLATGLLAGYPDDNGEPKFRCWSFLKDANNWMAHYAETGHGFTSTHVVWVDDPRVKH